jgi:hypothetical protein
LTAGQITFTGACCLPGDTCEALSESDCLLAGGTVPNGLCTEDDADDDGVVDVCDGCPDNPDLIAPGVCGCSTADSDGDGTLDCVDACPNDPFKSADAGVCGCGVPDVDSDGDGVPDCVDQCPGVDDALFLPECADAIPAMGEWGLVVLALLLLTAGKLCFGRRSLNA